MLQMMAKLFEFKKKKTLGPNRLFKAAARHLKTCLRPLFIYNCHKTLHSYHLLAQIYQRINNLARTGRPSAGPRGQIT